MNCPNCGKNIADGAKFCSNCGAPAEDPQAQQPVYQQPAQQPAYQSPVYQQPPIKKKASAAILVPGLIGAILVIVGVFLPYASVLGFSASLMDGGEDAYIFLGAGGLGLIFALTKLGVGQILMGLACIGFQAMEWDDAPRLASKGSGYYVILIGALLLVVGGIVTIVGKHNAKLQNKMQRLQ